MGPIYPLSQTGISGKADNTLLQGSSKGSIKGFHRKLRVGCFGRSALSPCSPPPLMLGCWGFLGGFCWSSGTSNDGHDVEGLLPRLARFLVGDLWLGSEHNVSTPVAGKGSELLSLLMGYEIGLNTATLGPPSSEDIDDPLGGPLIWS